MHSDHEKRKCRAKSSCTVQSEDRQPFCTVQTMYEDTYPSLCFFDVSLTSQTASLYILSLSLSYLAYFMCMPLISSYMFIFFYYSVHNIHFSIFLLKMFAIFCSNFFAIYSISVIRLQSILNFSDCISFFS